MLRPKRFTKSSFQIALCLTILSLAAVPGVVFAATPAPTPTVDPLTVQLSGIAQSKLDAEYNVLISGDSTKLTKANLTVTGLAAQGVSDAASTQLRIHDGLALHGLHYTKATSKLIVQKIVASQGSETITAEEDVTLLIDNGTKNPVTSEEVKMHIFHFTLQGNQWSLDKDEDADSYTPTSQVPDQFRVKGLPMSLTGKSDVPISRNSPGSISSNTAMVGIAAISGTYNPANAVKYARNYAFNNNSAYITYQNDCTSFVSQALNWGGWQHIGGWFDDAHNWWYSPNRILAWGDKTQSNSWIVTNYFYWFARYSGRATDAHYWSDLRPGDVIQMVNAGNTSGTLDHTMIVTTVDSYGNIYITEHSNPNIDKPLWLIAQQNPGASYYGTVMKYTY